MGTECRIVDLSRQFGRCRESELVMRCSTVERLPSVFRQVPLTVSRTNPRLSSHLQDQQAFAGVRHDNSNLGDSGTRQLKHFSGMQKVIG